MCLSSTYKQESINSIHSVGKLEVKGYTFKVNCNMGPRSCKGHSLFKIHVALGRTELAGELF